jgi:hypothetical protein
MPGFIHTEKDEARWKRAKDAAAKSTEHGTDHFWALSNYIYHKMGKSQQDIEKAEHFKKSLFGLSNSGLAVSEKISVPSATKMPKAKKMPTALDKPSKFFKNEGGIRHPSICKLKDFLHKKHRAKCE